MQTNLVLLFCLIASSSVVVVHVHGFVCDARLSNASVELREANAANCFSHPVVTGALSGQNDDKLNALLSAQNIKACESVTENMIQNELVLAFVGAVQQAQRTEGRSAEEMFMAFMSSMRDLPNSHYTSFCSFYQDGFKPCVQAALSTALSFVQDRSDGCCVNLDSMTSSIVGRTASDFMNDVLDIIDDLMCNKVATGQDQTCGYTMVQGLTGSSLQELNATLQAFVQIPQDQACKAYTGQQFTSTKGSKAVLAPQSPLGNCATGLDDAFTLVKEVYEFAKTSSNNASMELVSAMQNGTGDLSKAFAPGQCLDVGSVCVHFPTKFSKTCGFSALSDDPTKVSTASRRTAWWSVVASLGVVALSAAALYF